MKSPVIDDTLITAAVPGRVVSEDFEFSGATFSGTIQVGMDLPSPCTTCFLRVRQSRPVSGNVQTFVNIPID